MCSSPRLSRLPVTDVARHRRWLLVVVFASCVALADSEPAGAQGIDLTKLSIEDLLTIQITSVSRKEQTLSRTAAAVHVITQEDIRRSGATTLPDLLRMAPGVSVAQIDATSWAVSARGFNGHTSNKLLVLVDGRSVYSPMVGGVHWEMQNLPLDDIDRIEIIRGPGGTLWGTNATNGVINIITRPAEETRGVRASAGGGPGQRALGEFRYGGTLGEHLHYRAFAKYSERGYDDGQGNPDAGSVGLGGMRVDWSNDLDKISLQGSVQNGLNQHWRPNPASQGTENPLDKLMDFTEANVMASWTRSPSSRSERNLQVYYQSYGRTEGVAFHEGWDIADVEARQRLAMGERHELVAGVGYRFASVHIINEPGVAILPADERMHLFTGFVQDEIALSERIRVTPGAKLEHNSWTGLEVQPSIRGTWELTVHDAVWAAASRAVRTPTKIERGLQVIAGLVPGVDGAPPLLIQIQGDPNIGAEDVNAFEIGYRRQLGPASFDIATFRNNYSGLKSEAPGAIELSTHGGQPALILPIRFANLLDATTYGTEITTSWRPVEWWKTTASYAWLRVDESEGVSRARLEGPAPQHQFHLRSYFDLPGDIDASGMVYRVGGIEPLGVAPYTKLDGRVAWRVMKRLELSVTAQNLLHHNEAELSDNSASVMTNPVRRTVFSNVSWRF
jgi:iron complex outermembrane recepter protein